MGGRWGGTAGQNLFMIGGFGIPFGLMMIVFTGAELVTGNFMVFFLHFLHEPNKWGRFPSPFLLPPLWAANRLLWVRKRATPLDWLRLL